MRGSQGWRHKAWGREVSSILGRKEEGALQGRLQQRKRRKLQEPCCPWNRAPAFKQALGFLSLGPCSCCALPVQQAPSVFLKPQLKPLLKKKVFQFS